MNIHRNHLFHSIAICLVSIMALFTSCDKTDNVPGGIDSPDENTQYLLQPPYISIEPFGGGSPATRSAVAIEEERQAFNIGDELGNIITLGNSEVEDSPQTRVVADTYYRIVIYKKSDWDNNSLNIHAQRLCKTGSSAYLADAGDETTPIYLNPGDYRIFCYSFNKTSYTKLTPLANGATNVPLSDEDDFLSSDIIEKSISSSQLGTSVPLGTITLKHRCCRLIGTLSTAAFTSAGINATPKPSLSVTSTFTTAGNWSIKSPVFSGTASSSAAKTIPLSVSGNTYTGSLIVLPPSSQSLSANYSFYPKGGKQIPLTSKSITTNTTFSSGGSYSFTIQAVGAYVLTETEAVKIGSHTWAYANLNGTTKQQESKPWISGPLTGSGIPGASGSTTASSTTNDWWRWNVLNIDTDSNYGDQENTWNNNNDPCRSGLGISWKVPPQTYFDDLVRDNILKNKRVYINGETMTTNTYGWVKGNNTVGCVFADTNLGTCIFLPAAGLRGGSSYFNVVTHGNYWSATLYASNTNYAYYLGFNSGDCYVSSTFRTNGFSLRCAQ